MRALEQTEEPRAGAETAEPPPPPTLPPHRCEATEPWPPKNTPEDGNRRFLLALLRALSAWST
jgi:hypothetical protein